MVRQTPSTGERLAMRQRPETSPIMHQTWAKLLFMHWSIPVEQLRPHIPTRLELDTHLDRAWVAITPFTMWNVHAAGVPAIPGLNAFHECNVRTYVHLDGIPGVWFFSLNVNRMIPALAARLFYALNYLTAEIDLCQVGRSINYALRRDAQKDNGPGMLEVAWEIGDPLPLAPPDSLDFFLTERYCLYAGTEARLLRARVWHAPWSLRAAKVNALRSTLLASHRLPESDVPPLVHYSEELEVLVWAPEEV